jgi:hypothetical protein
MMIYRRSRLRSLVLVRVRRHLTLTEPAAIHAPGLPRASRPIEATKHRYRLKVPLRWGGRNLLRRSKWGCPLWSGRLVISRIIRNVILDDDVRRRKYLLPRSLHQPSVQYVRAILWNGSCRLPLPCRLDERGVMRSLSNRGLGWVAISVEQKSAEPTSAVVRRTTRLSACQGICRLGIRSGDGILTRTRS